MPPSAPLYDLTDTLALQVFGITVTSATVTRPQASPVNPGWNGASETTVILGQFLAGGANETYRVVVPNKRRTPHVPATPAGCATTATST